MIRQLSKLIIHLHLKLQLESDYSLHCVQSFIYLLWLYL